MTGGRARALLVRIGVLACALGCLVLPGCSGPTSPEKPYHQGVITSLDLQDSLRSMLVESDPGSPGCEDSSFYTIWDETKVYRLGGGRLDRVDLAVGQRVSVEWSGAQLDSCPPIRAAQKVFIQQ
jgi:hypothetical protein